MEKIREYQLTIPENPKGIVIIVAGIQEKSSRYQELTKRLFESDYIVVKIDYSIEKENQVLDIKRSSDLVSSIIEIHHELKLKYPTLKQNIVGHCFGCVIIKNVIQHRQVNFEKVILTSPLTKTIPQINVEIEIVRLIMKIKGRKAINKRLNRYFFMQYRMYARIKYKTSNWINSNKDEFEKFEKFQYYNYKLTNYYYLSVLKYLKKAEDPISVAQLKSNDYLFMFGSDDPISMFGRDLKNYNPKRVKIYPKMRHDIFFEKENEKVIGDLINFLNH